MAYHDNRSDYSRQEFSKNGQGVRGNVAYRKLSESYANDRNYPRWVFIVVNTVILLLTAALLFCLLIVFTPLGDIIALGQEKVDVCYTLEFYDADGTIASAPVVGTSLIDPKTGNVLGEITAVSVRPREVFAIVWQDEWEKLPQDATESAVAVTGKIVTVTVLANARYQKDFGYLIKDVNIAEGNSYLVSLAGTVSTATCTKIEREE